MTKSEAEKAIRHLVHEWARDCGLNIAVDHLSFLDFKAWIGREGYSHYLSFRSAVGPDYDAEIWFNHEMKQTRRD
jgi:hypothetical protein